MTEIEVSIIVQMRDTPGGPGLRKGPCAIGVARFTTPDSTPTKSWRGRFDDAVRRALARYTAQREGSHLAAPAIRAVPEQPRLFELLLRSHEANNKRTREGYEKKGPPPKKPNDGH